MEGRVGGWVDVRFDLRNWELNGREPLKSLKFRSENRGGRGEAAQEGKQENGRDKPGLKQRFV